MQQSNN